MPSVTVCPYCDVQAALVPGSTIYLERGDLAGKMFYRCEPCQAWVGCHPGTTTPLGRLANAELRAAKMRAHFAFDRLWKARRALGVLDARSKAYKWLTAMLGIERKDCHIGLFDVQTCERVIALCNPYGQECTSIKNS